MHAPLDLKSKLETVTKAGTKDGTKRWRSILVVAVAAVGIAAYFGRDTLTTWFGGASVAPVILVSGNIEAHQSVLGFNTVQSRIVELPFDEGQWVRAGTLIARLDDSDYRQQLAISKAALEVQQRQLAATEQNLVSAQKTVESDVADLDLKKANTTVPRRSCKRAPARSQARDQADAR